MDISCMMQKNAYYTLVKLEKSDYYKIIFNALIQELAKFYQWELINFQAKFIQRDAWQSGVTISQDE